MLTEDFGNTSPEPQEQENDSNGQNRAPISQGLIRGEAAQRELFTLIKENCKYLKVEIAARHRALVLARGERGKWTIGMVNTEDSASRETVARSLRTSRLACTFQPLEQMQWEILFRHAYDSELAPSEENSKGGAPPGHGQKGAALGNIAEQAKKWGAAPADEDNKNKTRDARSNSSSNSSNTGSSGNGNRVPVAREAATDAAVEDEIENALFGDRLDLTNTEEILGYAKRNENELLTIEFIKLMLLRFLLTKSSDLHVECGDAGGYIRFRHDGELQDVWDGIPLTRYREIVYSLCGLAGKDFTDMSRSEISGINKVRVMRDGEPVNVELRFSSLPSEPLPSIVLRSQLKPLRDMKQVGFLPKQMEMMEMAYSLDRGWIVVTGATGQGKSNTLETVYAALEAERIWKIIEIGEPIEIAAHRRVQVSIRKGSKFTWWDAFHTCLRQDPDVIGIGELRSRENAEVALDAALTGHLVLSTYHASTVEDTLSRFFEMGLSRDTLATGLNLICAQRLVKTLCENCKTIDRARSQAFGYTLYQKTGCALCLNKGYQGRTAIAEILFVNEEIGDWINNRLSAKEIVRLAIEKKYLVPMNKVAMAKLIEGKTSWEQVQGILGLIQHENKANRAPYDDSAAAAGHPFEYAGGNARYDDTTDNRDAIDGDYTMVDDWQETNR